MQWESEDYYALCEFGEGCCLNCPDSEEGCLCYDCKCKQCYWYDPLPDGSGECEKKYELIEKKKKQFKIKNKIEIEKSNLLFIKKKNYYNKEYNNKYSCQKCQYIFPSKEELIIIKNKEPLCVSWLGIIGINKKELEKIKEKVESEIYNEE